MIRLLKEALGEGISAKYVLFDSWFSNPRQLLDILGLKLHAIAMIKRSAKCYYEFEGKRMTVKQIFAACKKRRGRSKYLLSVPVKIHVKQEDVSEETAMSKIVCVRNRHNRKDWIALISTDVNLSEEDDCIFHVGSLSYLLAEKIDYQDKYNFNVYIYRDFRLSIIRRD